MIRTKNEILNDFKQLGCETTRNENSIFIITPVNNDKYWLDVEVNTKNNLVYVYSVAIDFVFMPLLNELVECVRLENENGN